jgi:hypothetical protein
LSPRTTANPAGAATGAAVAGEADYGELLWLIVSLELWAQRYLDERPATART